MPVSVPVPMQGREAWRRTLAVKERFLAGGDPDRLPPEGCGVRREIVHSWRRSLLSGVDAAATDLPRDEAAVPPDRLLRAARPVIDRLEQQIAGMRMWAFLADAECRLVGQVVGEPSLVAELQARDVRPGALFAEDVVGTNGLGTAVEQRRPFIVAGSEHFRAYENHATTVGAPVRDPVTGRLVGLLNINCGYELTNGLLLPLVTELARAIEARLPGAAGPAERELLDEITRVSRPIAGLSDEVFIANEAALALLDGGGDAALRRWARSAPGSERAAELRLRDGVVVLARRRTLPGGATVVALTPSARPRTSPKPPSPWRRLADQLAQAHAAGLPVLLLGERGTGKTTLARGFEPRTILDAAFHPADWVPRLETELADPSGTVVLRHLDALDPGLTGPTAALLASPRARVIATATDRPALFEWFPVILTVPALRDRVADIPALAGALIAELRPAPPRPRCTPEALAALAECDWPGNVRQLRQVVATALTRSLSCDITALDLPIATTRARHLTKLERAERHAIVTALRDASFDREAAARDLGVSRATIYRKLKRYGIRQS